MSIGDYGQSVVDHPVGRLALIIGGILAIFLIYKVYPDTLLILSWTVPLILFFWGISRFIIREKGDQLTIIAGCLLMLGGITRGLYLSTAMGELTGTIANLVPVVGVLVEIFASHYRSEE